MPLYVYVVYLHHAESEFPFGWLDNKMWDVVLLVINRNEIRLELLNIHYQYTVHGNATLCYFRKPAVLLLPHLIFAFE